MSTAAKVARNHSPVQIAGRQPDEQRLGSMFERAAIGIGTCTVDGRILETNTAFSKMLGYGRDAFAGMSVWELQPADSQQSKALIRELAQGARNSFKVDGRFRRKDESYLWSHLTVSVVRDIRGDPASLIAILEDATEHRRAAEKLREAEKMEVIGRLAGGIAHDFNNLLTGVLLYCDLLSAGLERGDPMRQHVDEIRMAGEQGAALTQQLLAVARKQVSQPQPVLLNEVVSSTENLLQRLIGEQIDLATALDPKAGRVLADQAQLRQVLLNLVLNARDAMPQGGRITVRTRSTALLTGGRPAIALLVEDTGCGMDEETRGRVFEPFFTTKKAGHGTGLGLSTVQRIIGESGGTIRIESEQGQGTRIEVLLPALPAAGASPPKVRSHAGETILLVDDHVSARNSMQRVLHHAGYRVLQASSGKRAMRVFAERANDVELLVADWMMPGMNGRELAEKLRQQKPRLKVLLISGYHDPQDEPAGLSVALIRKPFAGPVLIERIREILDFKGDAPCS